MLGIRHIFRIVLISIICCGGVVAALGQPVENLFLITLDGLRWQELFTGADPHLIDDSEFVKDTKELKEMFWRSNPMQRRETLLPFFWGTIAHEGQLYGNRNLGSEVNCSNIFWFSYPGYAEILCGKTNAAAIHSNAKVNNPDTTILEYLNQLPEFRGRVAAFGSWDVFPYIINEERSKIPVNAGFRRATHQNLSTREVFLNELQEEIPSPWSSVRLDAFTHHYALQYIQQYGPRVVYISYGETDDFAHDGRYDHYLKSAHQTDKFIQELWQYVQQDSQYQDKTAFIITTDHGRGDYRKGEWKSHGKTYEGSNAIWIAALGPRIAPLGEVRDMDKRLWQNQLASTCLQLLGRPALVRQDMGGPVITIVGAADH